MATYEVSISYVVGYSNQRTRHGFSVEADNLIAAKELAEQRVDKICEGGQFISDGKVESVTLFLQG